MINFRRSLAINFCASSGATIVQFLVSIALARLLEPAEIGVYSITVVFVNIAQIFRDFGVSTYLQREPHLTEESIRAATGIVITSSWTLAASLFWMSDALAYWFNEPSMSDVMKVLALGFVFIPFGAITNSLLTREFAAEKQALATIAGTSSFSITCLVLAYLDFGALSLAWANLANILACAAVFSIFRPKWMPWMPAFRNWAKIIHFGTGAVLSNCANALNNAVPDILLGRLAGANHVGLFSRANSTVSMFTYIAGSALNYGSTSYISQAHHRGEQLAPLVSKATALVTGVGWPALALTALLGRQLVTVLYGENWLASVDAIPALALAAAIAMSFTYTPAALIAIGRPYLATIPVAFTLITRVFLASFLFDGTLRSFAWTIFAATVAAVPVLLLLHAKYLGYSVRSLTRAVMPSGVVTLAMVAGCLTLQFLIGRGVHPIAEIGALVVPMGLIWYLGLRITGHPLLAEVHGLVNKMVTKLRQHG